MACLVAMSGKLGESFACVQDFFSIVPKLLLMSGLWFEFPYPNPFGLRPFSSRIQSTLVQKFLDEWQCHMGSISAGDKRSIRRPVNPCDRPRNEARFERRELVYQSETVVLFDHPLNVCRCGCRACQIQRNVYLSKHFGEARMRAYLRDIFAEAVDQDFLSRSLLKKVPVFV